MSAVSIALLLLCALLFLNALWGLPKLLRAIYPPKTWKPQWPKLSQK